MKHLNHITLGFVITFVLVGCLATAAQGAGVFTSTGSLITGRSSHSATLLPNGQVLVAGGRFVPFNIPGEGSEDYVNINSAELYDPATGTWSPTGSMGTISGPNVATLLPNSKVLCGVGSNWELYDPATGTWTPTGSPSNPNSGSATLLPNGKVLVAGRAATGTSAELYDPPTGTWSPTGSPLYAPTGPATLLANGKVLVAGSQDTNYNLLASAELYDPATGVWTPTGSMETARGGHIATLLPNGKVLVAGGVSNYNGSNYVYLASAELYDPATGTWSPTGSMGTARVGHTASLLANGLVLVAGGVSNYNGSNYVYLASAELYDPATGAWSTTASEGSAIYGHTASLLANGQVLIAGGEGPDIYIYNDDGDLEFSPTSSRAELYDPGTSSLNPFLNPVKLGDGSFQFGFINGSGPSYSVLASTNLSATVNTWTNLGAATEMPVGSGLFQFTDHQAPNYPQRFYRVSSP